MRIVALSDTHGRHEEVDVPDGDLLIFAGDMTLFGDVRDVRRFNEWLRSLPHPHKLVTAGNHDSCLLDPANQALITNARLLLHEVVEIDTFKIFVSPSARRYSDRCAFSIESAREARTRWDLIPRDIDILVTHGPPQGVMDIDLEETGDNPQGCPVLREWVDYFKPDIHIFGHIHANYGVRHGEHTTFINASQMSDGAHREMNNEPVVFDIR